MQKKCSMILILIYKKLNKKCKCYVSDNYTQEYKKQHSLKHQLKSKFSGYYSQSNFNMNKHYLLRGEDMMITYMNTWYIYIN